MWKVRKCRLTQPCIEAWHRYRKSYGPPTQLRNKSPTEEKLSDKIRALDVLYNIAKGGCVSKALIIEVPDDQVCV